MASLIARITTTSARAPLGRLLLAPLGLDVWEVGPGHLVVQVDETQAGRLQAMGYDVEQLRMTEQYLSASAADAAGYHTVATLEQDLRRLVEEHPEIAELREIGRSVEGRPLWALRIGERRDSSRKVAFFGCHHAREWISVEVPYLLAEHLLENSSTEPVQRWLQHGEVWVAPMVNPDGHAFTSARPENRLWRKNRRPNPDGTIGVDPNRNYGYMWGTLDVSTSSHVPADETYVGPRAFSEPEVRAVRDLVARELIGGVLTYHSYSQLVLYPWGYTSEPIEDDADLLGMRGLAEDMARAIRDVHGETYTPQPSSGLYPTAGDTADWTYGEYDAPSLTVELRPASALDGGFVLPAEQIQPCWEENRPAALAFIGHVLDGAAPRPRGAG
jgi:carboxypeptidase T